MRNAIYAKDDHYQIRKALPQADPLGEDDRHLALARTLACLSDMVMIGILLT